MSLEDINGKIEGNISTKDTIISGNILSKSMSISGNVQPAGQKIVYDAEWGDIKGNIKNQDDLQIELHERDNDSLSVWEVEKILYLG